MTALEEIDRLAEADESETVEFDATTDQRTEAARPLSAMLNGRGGRVLFGVQPVGDGGLPQRDGCHRRKRGEGVPR